VTGGFSFLEDGEIMLRSTMAAAVALALCGGVALAAQPTPVPNTPPDFSSFRFELGTWNCQQPLRSGDRKETDTYTMAYDGWQLRSHFVSPPFDKYRTRDIVGDAFTTYDSTLKIWVNQAVDNFGTYGLATSPGWVNDTITWAETNPDGTQVKTIETKVSDSKETFETLGNTRKGQPIVKMFTQTCIKST
jgi:hypothetical protein